MKYFTAIMAITVAGCSANDSDIPETTQWDGQTKKETDAVVTLRLPSEPAKILLNGDPAKTSADHGTGLVKVLIPSDDGGMKCENIFVVKFKDGTTGQLLANHCHGDELFDVKPGEIIDKRLTKEDVDNPADDDLAAARESGEGFAPGASLAFEWSANGFTQMPSEFKWAGSGRRSENFEPNFSLGVPETDNIIWSSECAGRGKIRSHIYMNIPGQKPGDNAPFKFETDKSSKTLAYTANFVDSGESSSFQIIQSTNDRMFAEMRAGQWAYMQMGDGDDATKIRVSLKGSSKALNAFLPACR